MEKQQMVDDEKEKLDKRLSEAAVKGNTAKVSALLGAGAEVNSVNERRRTPLMRAAWYGHQETVEILLTAGADITLRDDENNNAEADARNHGYTKVAEIIANFKAYRGPDEIIFYRPLSNRTLEEVFNFATRERFTLLRKSKYGDVEAMTREPFSAIEDETALRKAFDEHVRRGGTADEREIFPRQIPGKFRLP